LSNPFSKLQSHSLPGSFFLSAISENHLAIESRDREQLYFSVFDLRTGQLITEAPATGLTPWYTLVGLSGQHLLLQHFESRQNPDKVKLLAYDFSTHTLLGEVQDMSLSTHDISAPAFFAESSNDFALFRQLIGPEIVLGCEYLEIKDQLIISYYVKEGTSFTRSLLVLSDGTEVYRDVQDKEMKGIALGSFFTFQNRLIFVRHTRELIIHEI